MEAGRERERERVNAHLTAKVILRRDVIRQITSKSQGTCNVEGLRVVGNETGRRIPWQRSKHARLHCDIRWRVPLLVCSYGQLRP